MIASPTKRDNLSLAGFLMGLCEGDGEIRDLVRANSNTAFIPDRLLGLEPSQRKTVLEGLLPLGIGVQDADMSDEERQLVSRAFRDHEISILICSQTMAHGVNLPAQSIVFAMWGTRPAAIPMPCRRTSMSAPWRKTASPGLGA